MLERQLEELFAAGASPLEYVFATHTETAHSTGIGRVLQHYPAAVVVGDVSDLHLVFPECADRLRPLVPGQRIDLGGTELLAVDAVFRDMHTTRWAFDTSRKVLFTSDGMAHTHYHLAGHCGSFAEEAPDLALPDMTALFAEYAFAWTRFSDVEPYIARMDELIFRELGAAHDRAHTRARDLRPCRDAAQGLRGPSARKRQPILAPVILATTPLVPHREPISGAEVRSLIDAAADAGFDGVSIWTAHHDWAVADDMTSEEYFDYHRERGLTVPSSEVLLEWADTEENRHVLDVSARAGASYVIAATIEPRLPAAAGLATLCDLAAERGLSISLEFLPFTGVPNFGSAIRLLEEADRENLGLVLDLWHWQRGGPDVATLRSVPPERIDLLQLNDAPGTAGRGPDRSRA